MIAPATAERLLARLASEQSEQRLPSVVAGLLRDGELVWSGGRGTVDAVTPDAEVQYRCGSITKTFVAVCVMRLRDEGALALADPIGRFLPDTGIAEVTIEQLLSHSAGLRAETGEAWWERTPGGTFEQLTETTLRGGIAVCRRAPVSLLQRRLWRARGARRRIAGPAAGTRSSPMSCWSRLG